MTIQEFLKEKEKLKRKIYLENRDIVYYIDIINWQNIIGKETIVQFDISCKKGHYLKHSFILSRVTLNEIDIEVNKFIDEVRRKENGTI